MTEFEKLQAIIADVLNVSPETITPDTTFVIRSRKRRLMNNQIVR